MPEVYRTDAISTGDGRNGHSRTSDGMIDVDLATPKEQGGPGGATNPEQLFAAGRPRHGAWGSRWTAPRSP